MVRQILISMGITWGCMISVSHAESYSLKTKTSPFYTHSYEINGQQPFQENEIAKGKIVNLGPHLVYGNNLLQICFFPTQLAQEKRPTAKDLSIVTVETHETRTPASVNMQSSHKYLVYSVAPHLENEIRSASVCKKYQFNVTPEQVAEYAPEGPPPSDLSSPHQLQIQEVPKELQEPPRDIASVPTQQDLPQMNALPSIEGPAGHNTKGAPQFNPSPSLNDNFELPPPPPMPH